MKSTFCFLQVFKNKFCKLGNIFFRVFILTFMKSLFCFTAQIAEPPFNAFRSTCRMALSLSFDLYADRMLVRKPFYLSSRVIAVGHEAG